MAKAYDYRLASEWGGDYRSSAKAYLELLCFPEDLRHGTERGYAVGCRCDRCREEHNRHRREDYKRRRNA